MSELSVTPFGTVSPYCKGNCNGPGFMVRNGNKKILLDCGSGVSRMMQFPEDLNNLMIILSHLHIDHYCDLGSFQFASYVYKKLGLIDKRINVFVPEDYERVSHFFESESYLSFNHYNENTCLCGEFDISFLNNIHSVKTYSVKIVWDDTVIVYTADTDYNEKLIEFARDADLLINEATFLRGQNKTVGHMYAYEAGKLAHEAGVKQLMLTHFWPEISKEEYVMEAKEYFFNTLAACEGERLVLKK